MNMSNANSILRRQRRSGQTNLSSRQVSHGLASSQVKNATFVNVHKSMKILAIMDLRVLFLWIVVVYGRNPDRSRYHEPQIGSSSDSKGDVSGENGQPWHSKASEGGYSPSAAEAAFGVAGSGSEEISRYAQPVHFVSSFNSDGSEGNAYKIRRYLNPELETSEGKADEEEEPKRHPKRSFKNSSKPPQPKKRKQQQQYGKSGYPPGKTHKIQSEPSAMEYYTDLYSKQKDVEMILPKEKAIILPMVNGKPKPYDGYRAASDARPRGSDRLSPDYSGDVIYGKPKRGVDSIPPYRFRRSPAEYHGAIHPHFDYSDPENADRLAPKKDAYQKRRAYPKKHRSESGEKPHDYYKYPKGNKKTSKRSSGESQSEEHEEEEEEEEAEEQKEEKEEKEDEHRVPPYKYKYDSSFVIPELTIKYYPYERYVKGKENGDSKEEGSEDEESYESQIDEYTAGYEKYKKSLPADLEKEFGRPDFGDYSVEATENLENNKNCEKIEKPRGGQANEGNATEGAKARDDEAAEGTEVCYLCRDPKTGGSYEQCAYRAAPKSEKYFYGGSSSSKAEESPEPVNYRYRRSTFGDGFDLDAFIFGREPDVKRKVRHNKDYGGGRYERPRREQRRRNKHWESDADDAYPSLRGSYRSRDHYGSPSSRRHRKSKSSKDGPPDSYDGPKYTYEGPKETYEGPAEPYEGPIHKDYYITSDDRIENDEASPSNEETQSKPETKDYFDYNSYFPDRRYSQSSRRSKYAPEPKSEVEDLRDHYGTPGQGYSADYRFGPEHFVDDDDDEAVVEEKRERDEPKSDVKAKAAERRAKHSGSESRQAEERQAEAADKDAGSVKVFKNGDVCRKKKVDGMICMVCKNEKTAATYEQCQYSSKPKDKYYAFGSQKSYRTSDPNAERGERHPGEDQHPEKSDVIEKKILITKQRKVFQDDSGPLDALPGADLLGSPSDNLETRLYDDDDGNNGNDTDNRRVSESISRMEPRDGIEGLEEYLYSDADDSDKKASRQRGEYKSYDDYFHDIFPEFSTNKERRPYNEDSKESREEQEQEEEEDGHDDDDDDDDEKEESGSERRLNFDPFSNIRKFKDSTPSFLGVYPGDEEEEEEEAGARSAEASNEEPLRLMEKKSRIPPDFFMEESQEYHKKDIEKALGEFQSRDWSNCKKIVKDKLTCYQCIDEHGVNNEECMYVEASQPINEQLAYHERKELKPESLNVKKEVKPEEAAAVAETKPANPAKIELAKRPKNAKEEAPATTTTARGTVAARWRQIGDFGGVPESVPEEDVMTPVPSATTEAVVRDSTDKPPRMRIAKRNQKKRIKTTANVETTTEAFRKRKYPVKKFAEAAGNLDDALPRVAGITTPAAAG